MQRRWFVPWDWIYRPVAWPGLLLVICVVIFCAQVFLAIDRHSHSVVILSMASFPTSCRV